MAVALLLMLVVPGTSSAVNDEGAGASPGYGIRPAYYDDTTLPGGHHSFSLEPGTSIDDAVEIFNLSYEPLRFDLYGAELLMVDGGGFAPADRDESSRGSGDWIIPRETTVDVDGRSRLRVPFTVSVPEDALPGDHPGTIVVEPHTPEGEAGIALRTRLAQRVLITVPGEIEVGAALGPLAATREGGQVHFGLPVANTGNVTFTTSGTVEVTARGDRHSLGLGPDGLYAVPGGEARLGAVWEDPPLIGRARAHAVLEVQVGDREPVPYTTERITVWLVPWAALLVVVAIVLLTALVAYLSRERRRRWREHRRDDREVLRRHREERRLEERDEPSRPRVEA